MALSNVASNKRSLWGRIKSFMGPQDMTVGPPGMNLTKFAVPLLLGNIAQQLYSTIDSIVVGRYVGDTALAAIGSTVPIINFLLFMFMAISTGTGILVSQYFGAKNKEKLNLTIGNALTLIIVSSVLMMLVAIPFSTQILGLMSTPDEIIHMASDYLRITFIGILGAAMYNIISGILRGLGDSIMPLLFLLIATITNTVLDIWFIAGLNWGVAGAAWATIISQALSATLCIIHLLRMRDVVEVKARYLKPDKSLSMSLIRIGLPSGLTQAIFSFAMVMVQALTNTMGYMVITTNTAVMRIDGFAMLPNFSFGMAVSTFVGQNIGARRIDRVREGTKSAVKLSVGTSVFLVSMIMIFGPILLRMFTTTPAIIDLGTRQLRILALGYIAMAFTQVFGGIMRGAGDTMPSMWISLFTTIVIRVPLAYTLAWLTRSDAWPNGHPYSLYFSLLSVWILNAIITYTWYRRGRWKTKNVIEPSGPLPSEVEAGITEEEYVRVPVESPLE